MVQSHPVLTPTSRGKKGEETNTSHVKVQMPTKKYANSETNAPAPSTVALIEPTPPVAEALASAVLARVLRQVNLEGLREKVLDKAATRLARSVQIDKIIERIVGQSEQHLSDRLSERVLEHIALGAPQEERTEGS